MKFTDYLNEYDSIDEIPNNNLLTEAGFARVLQKMKDNDFSVITAFRDKFNKKENLKRNKELRSELRSKGMGVYPVIGHWQECQDPEIEYEDCPKDQLKDVVERSFLVAKPNDMSQNDFKQLIQDLTSKYQQDGAVLSMDGVIYIIDKNGKLDKKGTNITLNKINQAYSRYVKKKDIPFVFESEVPGSNSGRQLFEKEQLKYPRCSNEELRNW